MAGADLDVEVILVLGFANLVADGMSMGLGDYISEIADQEFSQSERQREMWEFENFKAGEIEEMVEIYMGKGISREDAEIILNTMAKYPDFFVDHMLIQELDIKPVEEGDSPVKNGKFINYFIFYILYFLFSLLNQFILVCHFLH